MRQKVGCKVHLTSNGSLVDNRAVLCTGLSAYTHVELPYYSKFILIAAYLASYNPARTDRRFFLKVTVTSCSYENPRSTVGLAGSNMSFKNIVCILNM